MVSDEVVIFEPFYENYGPDAILSGATPRYVRLVPPEPSERALLFGLVHELAGELGFGWCRRAWGIHQAATQLPPGPARDGAEAFGRKYGYRAEEGTLYARRVREVLALFAERVRPTPRPLPTGAQQEFDAVLLRRRQLVEMRAAEQIRLAQAPRPEVRPSLVAHIDFLTAQLIDLDAQLDTLVQASPLWQGQEALLTSVPVGGTSICRAWLTP